MLSFSAKPQLRRPFSWSSNPIYRQIFSTFRVAMSSTTRDTLSNGHILSSMSSLKSRSTSRGEHSTQKRRALPWDDMSPGAAWDMMVSLSELTRHMTDVPITDTEAWVHRPVEERMRETKQKKKIGRPLNSFMLYPLAYTNRIKMCSRRCSPQVSFSIAGKSWHKEPQNFRDKYQGLAQIGHEWSCLSISRLQIQTNVAKTAICGRVCSRY